MDFVLSPYANPPFLYTSTFFPQLFIVGSIASFLFSVRRFLALVC